MSLKSNGRPAASAAPAAFSGLWQVAHNSVLLLSPWNESRWWQSLQRWTSTISRRATGELSVIGNTTPADDVTPISAYSGVDVSLTFTMVRPSRNDSPEPPMRPDGSGFPPALLYDPSAFSVGAPPAAAGEPTGAAVVARKSI